MKQEELRRLEREREENRKRRQALSSLSVFNIPVFRTFQWSLEEQEEWEQAMRRKFAEEACEHLLHILDYLATHVRARVQLAT